MKSQWKVIFVNPETNQEVCKPMLCKNKAEAELEADRFNRSRQNDQCIDVVAGVSQTILAPDLLLKAPNRTLKKIRDLSADLLFSDEPLKGRELRKAAQELAGLICDMDFHIREGGCFPKDWEPVANHINTKPSVN